MLSYPAVRAIAAGLASKNSSEPFTWPLGSGWQLRKLAAKPQLVLSHKEESEEEAWIVEDLRVRRNFTPGLSLRVSRDATLESQTEAAESSCRFLLDLPLNATVVLRGAQPGDRFCPGLSSRARAIKLTYFLHREMKVPREARYGWPVIAIQAPQLPEVGCSCSALLCRRRLLCHELQSLACPCGGGLDGTLAWTGDGKVSV